MTINNQEDIITELKNCTNEMVKLQNLFLSFIDCISEDKLHYQVLIEYIDQNKILEDNHKTREFFYIISEISCNHHRYINFYEKIEYIIVDLRNAMSKSISKEEILNIFINNKRIILFLFLKKILTPDINLVLRVFNIENSNNLSKCFVMKNDPNLNREENNKIALNIDEIQIEIEKLGGNNEKICKIIQKDLIEDFKSLKADSNATLDLSIYETNEFLRDRTPSIIEYSAFYGSIKIFKHLTSDCAELSSDLWLYAVHGRNIDLIHEIEKRKIDCPYEECVIESIKCHHNEIAQYIMQNCNSVDNQEDLSLINLHFLQKSFEFYNYEMINQIFEMIDFDTNKNEVFPLICQNDYFYIIQLFLCVKDLDINGQTILIFLNLIMIFIYYFNDVLNSMF